MLGGVEWNRNSPTYESHPYSGEFNKLVKANGAKPSALAFLGDFAAGGGAPQGDTQIEQADAALHPGSTSALLSLFMKGRNDPKFARPGRWIIAKAIVNKHADLAAIGLTSDATVPEIYTTLTYANSIGANGAGRKEMVEVFAAVGRRMGRFRGMFNRGQDYEGGGGF